MEENLSYEERDIGLKKILEKPYNKICFDCGCKDPRWSSPYLGILICYDCAGRHRSYGTHISFVRSLDLDKWKKKFLTFLEIAGNEYTKKRFEEMNVPKIDQIYDYNNDLVLKYRKELELKVMKIYGVQPPQAEKNDNSKQKKKNNYVNNSERNIRDKFNPFNIMIIIIILGCTIFISKKYIFDKK